MKKVLLSLFLMSSAQSQVIDLNHYSFENMVMGYNAFNLAPEIGLYLAALAKNYQVTTVIETGTSTADTTFFLALFFDEVHTIEIAEALYKSAKERLPQNVTCHFGSSEKILHELLPSLKDKPLFLYLDAHWRDYWPLLDELEEISKTHRDNCIVIIDDFKVPGRPDIPYDSYGIHECCFEYVREKLGQVFSEYTYFYLIPRHLGSRAKLVVIPKKWDEGRW